MNVAAAPTATARSTRAATAITWETAIIIVKEAVATRGAVSAAILVAHWPTEGQGEETARAERLVEYVRV